MHKQPVQLGSHKWSFPLNFNMVFLVSSLLKVIVKTHYSVLFGISCPPALEHWSLIPSHHTEEGVWREPVIIPPSFPRALVLSVKSASLELLLFLRAPVCFICCRLLEN